MLLALDTSTRIIGLALFNGFEVLYESVWTTQDFHTVELAPAVLQALDRTGKEVADIEAVGVALGPGSFTSLRVGLAFAKGLALAQRVPLIGIPTLDVVALAQPVEDAPLVAIVEAGRGRLAVGWYHEISGNWRSSGAVDVMTSQDLAKRIRKPTIICGELDEDTRRVLGRKYKNSRLSSPAHSLRRPAVLAELAWDRLEKDQLDDPKTLAPFYLHLKEG